MSIATKPIISEMIYLQDLSKDVKEMEGDCPRDEQAWVMIRQATESDNLRREQVITKVELFHETGVTREIRQSTIRNDRAYEAFLTLHAIGNIMGPDGSPLFEFKDTGPYNKVKGTFDKFRGDFGLLPGAVARAIALAVYSINEDWNWMRMAPDKGEDEEENPT